MRRTISLDGVWERRDFLDEAWRWSDALRAPDERSRSDGPPVKTVSAGWRAGRVPGSTMDDAWRGGEIPNPYVDRDSLAAEWVAQRTWLYRRRFTVPADAPGRAALRFDGIDPGGLVFVDGEQVARHSGMFLPAEVDLAERLAPGSSHDLVVVVDPAPPMPSQVSRTELARHHRTRMGYGWDFCPRMVQTGIWRSVSLEFRERAWLARPRVTVVAGQDDPEATVEVACRVGGEPLGLDLRASLVDLAADREVASARGSPGDPMRLAVADPRRWWPNGSGEPALHRLTVRLAEDDTVLDERSARIGIRSFELRQNDGAPGGARPYTPVINGRRTPIRGWNWVPIDALYGVPRPERLRHLVELARRAEVNLLRVWGGGLIESDTFYDACDEAGIMVWQEFAQSSSGVSNTPADDHALVRLMRDEAEAIVPLRTHHPSLVLWCGGNELTDAGGRPLTDDHPVLGALREVVAGADPGRAWLPTSPSGPRFENTLAAIAQDPDSLHDVHGPWEHQGLAEQHALANAATSLLHSEFGVEGMTNLPAIRATVTDPARWEADRTDAVMAHRGAWWNNQPFVQRAFGGGLSLEELERASQHLQADGLRTLVEGDRRRWPRCAGTLPWQLNESFPNAWCTSAVDYFGVPKGAYYAVADAYAPILAGLTLDAPVLDGASEVAVIPWLANDTPSRRTGSIQLALRDGVGSILDAPSVPIDCGPSTVAEGPRVTLGIPRSAGDLLVLDATFAGRTSRRLLSRTATLAPIRELPSTTVETAVDRGDDAWTVRVAVAGRSAALELRLDDARPVGWPSRSGAVYLDANLVTLLPGEERTFRAEWRDVPPAERCLRLSGWNVAERILAGG